MGWGGCERCASALRPCWQAGGTARRPPAAPAPASAAGCRGTPPRGSWRRWRPRRARSAGRGGPGVGCQRLAGWQRDDGWSSAASPAASAQQHTCSLPIASCSPRYSAARVTRSPVPRPTTWLLSTYLSTAALAASLRGQIAIALAQWRRTGAGSRLARDVERVYTSLGILCAVPCTRQQRASARGPTADGAACRPGTGLGGAACGPGSHRS